VLNVDSVEYEEKMIRLLSAAYKRDKENPLERERYKDAMQTLKDSDHYILVMAVPALAPPRGSTHVTRDLFIYVVIALAIVIAITLFAIWR